VQEGPGNGPAPGKGLWLALLAGLVVLSLVLAYVARDRLTIETLSDHHMNLMDWRDSNLVLAALGFFAAYVAAAAVAVPGIALLTLLGGYLFGALAGTLMVVIAATIGATALFMAARAGLGDGVLRLLKKRVPDDGKMAALAESLKQNELKALFLLRLTPVIPFFLCNIIPAMAGVGLRNFLLSTSLGILPGTFVFATAGRGLGAVLASGGTPDIGALTPLLLSIPAVILGAVLAVRMLRRI